MDMEMALTWCLPIVGGWLAGPGDGDDDDDDDDDQPDGDVGNIDPDEDEGYDDDEDDDDEEPLQVRGLQLRHRRGERVPKPRYSRFQPVRCSVSNCARSRAKNSRSSSRPA